MWSSNQYLMVVQRKIIYHFGVFDVLSVCGLVHKFGRPKSKDKSKIDISSVTKDRDCRILVVRLAGQMGFHFKMVRSTVHGLSVDKVFGVKI